MVKSKVFKIILIFVVLMVLLFLSYKFFFKKGIKTIENQIKVEETTVSTSLLCPRTTPYEMKPEFERGISLLYQRIDENKGNSTVPEDLKPTIDKFLQIRNCLNVQYDETSSDDDAEGYFVFDPESSVDNLQIYVNKKYSDYDDALTALLLAHEVTHATQFVDFKINNSDISCVDKEIEAIRMEFRLLRSFKYSENTSIKSRIAYEQEIGNRIGRLNIRMEIAGLNSVSQLLDLQDEILNVCDKENDKRSDANKINIFECAGKIETKYIREYVVSNPFYQEECGL